MAFGRISALIVGKKNIKVIYISFYHFLFILNESLNFQIHSTHLGGERGHSPFHALFL